MTVQFIGTGFPYGMEYYEEEQRCWKILTTQIDKHYPNERNVLISLTWFGLQFNTPGWQMILDCECNKTSYDNIFFLATVDPPYINDTIIREVKNKLRALRVFYLGNFDSPHQFNFFAPIFAKKSKKYSDKELIPTEITHTYVNYNRKPKEHRVNFVKMLIAEDLLKFGTVTLGTDETNDLLLTIGEHNEDYEQWGNSKCHWNRFGVPHDMYSLHRLDIWKETFLYINAATEFSPTNDLFCQQDTFKPLVGLRPYVINGVQKTYQWLRINGFRTFNHYWPHIDIEYGGVHSTIIKLIRFLNSMNKTELLLMYNDMLPDLIHNRERFFEFAQEQEYKIEHIFE